MSRATTKTFKCNFNYALSSPCKPQFPDPSSSIACHTSRHAPKGVGFRFVRKVHAQINTQRVQRSAVMAAKAQSTKGLHIKPKQNFNFNEYAQLKGRRGGGRGASSLTGHKLQKYAEALPNVFINNGNRNAISLPRKMHFTTKRRQRIFKNFFAVGFVGLQPCQSFNITFD